MGLETLEVLVEDLGLSRPDDGLLDVLDPGGHQALGVEAGVGDLLVAELELVDQLPADLAIAPILAPLAHIAGEAAGLSAGSATSSG